jgi:type VI secretion system protein ImpL
MASWQAQQLKYAFGIGSFMSFYGIVGLIVYMLPTTTVGNPTKIVIIALVLLTIPFALLIAFLGARRNKKKAEKAETAAVPAAQASEGAPADAQPQKLAAPSGNYADLNGGAEEVAQFLKSSNLGVGKDAVYALPWYLVAGVPKSGKSSLVVSSNLNFQTLPSQRQSEQKLVRPTRGVDWRVTSDAVFVDTAGRYQTEGVDSDEWGALLETIRKYRPNRPIDGFLLVVNVGRVIQANEREAEEMAKVLRSRLDEATQRLKTRFPVYVVFTNADEIEGFRDSFSSSKGEDKSLVWGSTIPLEKSDNAQALFDGEFEILHNAVMRRRLLRLSAPFPPVRQLRIFNFPLHFGSARRKLGAFISTLFRPNPFSESPFLRGFYFTAAPAGKSNSNGPQAVGDSYFTQRFFRDVVLRDKDLVKTFIAQRQRAPIFGWFLTILLAFITIFLLAMSGVSLASNRSMLNDAKDKGEKVLTIVRSDAGKKTLEKSPDEARREMSSIDDLRQLMVRLDDNERNGAPLYMRFGLYSGNRVYKEQLLPIYMNAIEQRFKKPTIARVEAELQKFASSSPVANTAKLTDQEEQTLGKNYDLLKAYLMLTGTYKDKAEPTHIVTTLKDYWFQESKLPKDLELTAQQQLEFWAKQVDRDDDEYRFPRINANDKLVADVRQKLQAFPAANRYYKRKVTEISKDLDDKYGPTNVTTILTRNGADTSLMDGNYSVPNAYTRAGYEQMKIAIAEADVKLSEGDWVMGETGRRDVTQTTDSSKIQDMYYRDYSDQWRSFIKSVNVKPYKNKDEATNAFAVFSSASSPMKILLTEVAKNTNLSAPIDEGGWWSWIKSWFQSKKSTDTGGNTQPEKDFRPLFTFIGKKDQAEAPPVEKYQTEMGNIYKEINGRSADELRGIAQEMANDKDPLKLRARDTAIANLTKAFSETPASQEVAQLLQEPLGNLQELLGTDAKAQLTKMWTDQIAPAAREIETGYPFDDSQTEVDLTKLSGYLNPSDGKLSQFYDQRLKKYFEESNGQLKLKADSPVKFSDEFVAYLNAAFALRKALYGTSPTPKFEYEITLQPSKDGMVQLMIDGQKVSSDGTGAFKGTFPAATGSETGVLISFGSVSDTAAPPAANTANTNTAPKTPAQPTASSSATEQRFPGNWGLFKFVDAGKPQKQASGDYLLTYNLGGKTVTAVIKPSGGDLFDKSIFKSFKAPQNFLKQN